jgi:hypothetical protein
VRCTWRFGGRDGVLVAPADPNRGRQAREFTVKLNTLAVQAGDH